MDGPIPRRILLVQTSFLGDVVLTTALDRRLRDAFPAAEIAWMVRPDAASIVEPLLGKEHVLVYDKRGGDRGFSGIGRVAGRLREREFDAAIAVQRSLRTALVLRRAGIPNVVGFAGSPGSWLYDRRVPAAGAHARDRLVALASGLGVAPAPPPMPRLVVDPEAAAAVRTRLAEAGFGAGSDFLVLAPGSAWETKRWPPERFGEAASRLLGSIAEAAVVVGGAGDASLAAGLREAAGVSGTKILDWTGQTSIPELIALVAEARLLVGNDSAPGHIAAATGTPVVSLFGPTVPAQGFAPLGEAAVVVERRDLGCRPCSRHGGRRCPIGTHECLQELPAEAVEAAARELLGAGT